MYGTGARVDIPSAKDHKYDHIAVGAPAFDWIKGCDIEQELGMHVPTKNQNGSGSCVKQAISTYIWVKNVKEMMSKRDLTELDKRFLQEKWIISAKAGYSQIHVDPWGAYPRDGMMLWRNWGALPESRVPSYENGNPPSEEFMQDLSWMSAENSREAENLQCADVRVVSRDIDSIAQAIRDNDGLCLGVYVDWNNDWSSAYPRIGDLVNPHYVYAGKAKMVLGEKFIGIKNSWGNIGEDGWQWLHESWFHDHVFSPWVAYDKPNTGWFKLIDRQGQPRKIPGFLMYWLSHLVYKRNFKV